MDAYATRKDIILARRCDTPAKIHDFIGIGFGPSHLAVAIALEESEQSTGIQLDGFFVDERDTFAWHPGMLLEDSRLQVAFLKDLISMKNPRSRYTFINYLFEQGRLHEFINLRTFYPTRLEYDSYYRWVSKQFAGSVRYQAKVVGVEPALSEDGSVEHLEVQVKQGSDGRVCSHLTRNLLIAGGGEPFVPSGVALSTSGRVFHSSDCLTNLKRHYSDRQAPYKFVVVGSGQTAADIFAFLITKYSNAEVKIAMRGFGFKPQDDTHFVNELFFPDATDLFFRLPIQKRRELLSRHADVTHSAVDLDLIPIIYDAMYNDRALGHNRLQLCRFLELTGVQEAASSVAAIFRDVHSAASVEIAADAVILATGYRRYKNLPILKDIDTHLVGSSDGYVVNRNYSIERHPNFQPKVYLEGYCEATHGFSEVLLSLLPVRSREIVDEMTYDKKHAYSPVQSFAIPEELDGVAFDRRRPIAQQNGRG